MECECTFLIHRTATPSSWYWRPFLGECPFAIPRSCLREYPELADKPCKSKSKIGSFVSSPVLWRVLTAMWILSAQELLGCPWLRRALASSKSVSLSSNSYVFLLRSSEARVGSRLAIFAQRSVSCPDLPPLVELGALGRAFLGGAGGRQRASMK